MKRDALLVLGQAEHKTSWDDIINMKMIACERLPRNTTSDVRSGRFREQKL